jgi:ATP-dependent RNA helicase SUPV3L1/SUV3
MVPQNIRFDVAVIDEIQMLGDQERGSAWTTALLGVQAQEVHVCGEERAVGIVQAICASVGDKCIVHRYQRLSPLRTMDQALGGDLSKLQKGDAIIAFSRIALHVLKQNIERETGRRCAIIYGGLPPEVRTQQAALFNDPDNDYDYIVASDAIGMGLNLEIRRVILETVAKYDGNQNRLLTYPEIKQIGGRAGRYRSATNPDGTGGKAENAGYVTSLDRDDLRHIHRAFAKNVKDIEHAYINPPPSIIERFASYYPPGTPLSFILMRIRTAARIGDRFRMHVTPDTLEIADMVQDIPLTIYDRIVFCHMPVRLRKEGVVDIVRAMARAVAENQSGELLSIKEIPLHVLELDFAVDMNKSGHEYLEKLESLHDAITQYTWLSYRYPTVFRDQTLAFHVRSLVQQRMVDVLERQDFSGLNLAQIRRRERFKAHSRNNLNKALGASEDEYEEAEEQDEPVDSLVEGIRGVAHS